jgi:hypothetical protein
MPRRALAIAAAFVLLVPATATAKHFTGWGTASPVVVANSAFADGCPIESPNGLELYIASNRTGGTVQGDPNDIWVLTREAVDDEWSSPVNLGARVNSSAADFCPTPLNGDWLLFVSARGGPHACGVAPAGDIYITRKHPVRGWETPSHLGCAPAGPNTAGGEFSPSLVETDEGTMLFYSSPGTGGLQDIYVSEMRSDGTFAAGVPVTGVNVNLAGAHDQMPNVGRDGLEMVFASNRGGGAGSFDIYVTTRDSTADAWGPPVTAGSGVNTLDSETRPSLSGDGERLHFGRAPAAGGPGDVYVSIRTKVTGSD